MSRIPPSRRSHAPPRLPVGLHVPPGEPTLHAINAPYPVEPVFRAMRADPDGLPRVGRAARELGVRVEGDVIDLHVAVDGSVAPESGGMSVALVDARHLPKHRRPPSLGGEGRDPVFAFPTARMPVDLAIRVDRHPHGLVEAAFPCKLLHYEERLAATRSFWTRAHD